MFYLIKAFVVNIVVTAVFDYVWMTFIMGHVYVEKLRGIANIQGDKFIVNLTAAGITYLIMSVGMVVLVINKTASSFGALFLGAVFGLVAFGTFDFTNKAILPNWPWSFMMIDIAWGTALCAASSYLTYLICNQK